MPSFTTNSYFFDHIMPYIAVAEGGYVNDPLGGPTYMGITERNLLAFLGNTSGSNLGWHVKDLINKPELISTIYLAWYYLPVHGYELMPKTSVVMFDGAVQHGVGTMVQRLQKLIQESPEDGIFGPATLGKVLNILSNDTLNDEHMAENLLSSRKAYYLNLNQPADIHGWEDRLNFLANTFNINWHW